jgi:hypothetical protein
VWSKTTRDYDRGKTFELYRELASLQDYLLIDQERVYLEHYHKLEDDRRVLTLFNHLDTTLTLTSIEVSLAVSHIYHKVGWSMKKQTLREARIPYDIPLAEALLGDEVVILEKEGRPVAALAPMAEYTAFQFWREAEKPR